MTTYSISGTWLLADGVRVLSCGAATPAEMTALCAKYQAEADAQKVKDTMTCAAEKAAAIKKVRDLREIALNRIAGMHTVSIDAVVLAALASARVSLLNITSGGSVLAATDGAATHAALTTAWNSTAATLATSAPSAANIFTGLEV